MGEGCSFMVVVSFLNSFVYGYQYEKCAGEYRRLYCQLLTGCSKNPATDTCYCPEGSTQGRRSYPVCHAYFFTGWSPRTFCCVQKSYRLFPCTNWCGQLQDSTCT